MEKKIEGPYYGTPPRQGTAGDPDGGAGGAGPNETFTINGNGPDTYNNTIVFGGVGNGGGGGYSPPAPGIGGGGGSSGLGGNGDAYTNTKVNSSTSTVFAYATGDGGSSGEAGEPGNPHTAFVGHGDSGGAGGNGVAGAYAKNTLGQARASAKTQGGTGGGGYGASYKAGAGGSATIGTQSQVVGQPASDPVDAVGKSAFASAYQVGGQGGGGYAGATGGKGISSTLINAVTGTATDGGLYLTQEADGGSGGGTNGGGTGGAADYGKSYLTFSDSKTGSTPGTTYEAGTTYLRGISNAVGGSGGGVEGSGTGVNGANAYATSTITGPHAVVAEAQAGSTDHGGAGGTSYGGAGIGAVAGTVNAAAVATSTTLGSDNVTATTKTYGADGGYAQGTSGHRSAGAGGAVTGATATATELTATGGLATANVDSNGGTGGSVAGVAGTDAGAGGVVSGAQATVTGYAGYASVIQQGGRGGNGGYAAGFGGANGGAGADSVLNTEVAGTVIVPASKKFGGELRLSQSVIGGTGGSSDGGLAGTAGDANSQLLPPESTTASLLEGTSTAQGGQGGAGVGVVSDGRAGGTAVSDVVLAGAYAVTVAGSTATGGTGGRSDANPGVGGTAHATAAANSTTTLNYSVSVTTAANGGVGGSYYTANGGSGAAGGSVLEASARAVEPDAAAGSLASARAINYGGLGGRGIGSGQSGGAGGAVDVTRTVNNGSTVVYNGYTKAYASGYAASAYVRQTGGAGGGGDAGQGAPAGAQGGAGAPSRLLDDVYGRTTGGALTLDQIAAGGAGGGSSTTKGGVGGNAYSHLSFGNNDSPQSSSVTGSVTADGGAGGGATAVVGATGGYGNAQINLQGLSTGLVTANATAEGGAGGTGLTTGVNGTATADAAADATSTTDAAGTGAASANAFAYGGGAGAAQGQADATSMATTAAGQEATATSSANGGTDLDNEAKSTASTVGGIGGVLGIEATADATGGNSVTAVTNAEVDTATADLWAEPGFNGAQNSVYASVGVLAPGSDLLASLLSTTNNTTDPLIATQLGGANATILGYGTQGGYAIADASGLQTLNSAEIFTLDDASLSGHLIAGLVSDNLIGAGVSSLIFTATVGGTLVAATVQNGPTLQGGTIVQTQTFNAQGISTTNPNETVAEYFTDHALDLGAVPDTSGAPLLVSLGLTMTTSTPGDGFEASFLLGSNAITQATWSGTSGTDLGVAANWGGSLPAPNSTVIFDELAGGLLTGTLKAGDAIFNTLNSWLMHDVTMILEGVLDPLALTDTGNLVVVGGTIAAAGSIVIESTAGAYMAVQGGEQISTEGVVLGFDAGQSGALTVSGAGTSIQNTGTDGSLHVGTDGSGVVTVTGGASLTDAAVDTLGAAAGGAGELDISAGGTLVDAGLIVGDAGLGSVAITSGGTLITEPVVAAIVANQSGAAGSSVGVTGAGSSWQVNGALLVGDAAAGSLRIAAGGTVSAASLDSGVLAAGEADIAVTGTASLLTLTGQLTIGDASSADLSISNGATVRAENGDIGVNAGPNPTTPGGAGEVDIEGIGSRLYIANNLNIGDAGTGVLVMGVGTTLSVENSFNVGVNGVFQQFGGVLDPATFTNKGSVTGGNGAVVNIGSTLVNDGVYAAAPGDYTLNIGTLNAGTLQGGTIAGTGSLVIGNVGDLIINSGTVVDTQSVEFNNSGTTGTLTIGTLVGFKGIIDSFNTGAEIILAGTSIVSESFVDNTVTLFGTGGAELGTLAFGANAVTGGTLTTSDGALVQVACFAEGTRIATAYGEVAVETLRVGDMVRTVLAEGAAAAPLIWIGRREIDCARHAQPRTVWPVRVTAGAFGPGRPHTDLFLSPDHAVYVGEVLIPIRRLINGSSIVQLPVERVTYYHLELAEHDVLLAEGMPAESYLDMRDGSNYANRSGPVRLYPDYAARMWEAFGCAPLIVTGPELAAARAVVATFAAQCASISAPVTTRAAA